RNKNFLEHQAYPPAFRPLKVRPRSNAGAASASVRRSQRTSGNTSTMNFWLVLAVNSVTFGGLLFLLSAGFSLIFGLMRIPNLTHGSLFMLGAYFGAAL